MAGHVGNMEPGEAGDYPLDPRTAGAAISRLVAPKSTVTGTGCWEPDGLQAASMGFGKDYVNTENKRFLPVTGGMHGQSL